MSVAAPGATTATVPLLAGDTLGALANAVPTVASEAIVTAVLSTTPNIIHANTKKKKKKN